MASAQFPSNKRKGVRFIIWILSVLAIATWPGVVQHDEETNLAAMWLLPCRLQLHRSLANHCRFVLQRGRDHANLCIRLLPLLLFDRFANPWQGLHPITGIKPRSVDLVLEPRT